MLSALPRVESASAMHAVAARGLRLTPVQTMYAGDIAFHVDDAMQAPDSDAMVVLLETTVIGFYRLDYPTARVPPQTPDRRMVTLRAFALDLAWQGRGFALPAIEACCADLARRHPERPWLALTVHAANTVALHLYRRAGFIAADSQLVGGSGGPLLVMRRAPGVGQCRP